MAASGLVTLASQYSAKETIDRLEAAVKAKGLAVFAHGIAPQTAAVTQNLASALAALTEHAAGR